MGYDASLISGRRVLSLRYEIQLPTGWRLPEPQPAWETTLGDFDVHLVGLQLTARPKSDYYSIESAHAAFEPSLRSMEAQDDLRSQH